MKVVRDSRCTLGRMQSLRCQSRIPSAATWQSSTHDVDRAREVRRAHSFLSLFPEQLKGAHGILEGRCSLKPVLSPRGEFSAQVFHAHQLKTSFSCGSAAVSGSKRLTRIILVEHVMGGFPRSASHLDTTRETKEKCFPNVTDTVHRVVFHGMDAVLENERNTEQQGGKG